MSFKLVVIATRTDLTERVIQAAKRVGATGATVLPARGTGAGEARTFFGLSVDIQRDVIFFLMEERLVSAVMKAVHTDGGFEKPGTGIVFVLDVEQIAGLESQLSTSKPEMA